MRFQNETRAVLPLRHRRSRPTRRRLPVLARWAIVVAVLGATMFGFVPAAAAHTDFEGSTPADGEVLDQPVSEIRVRFTAASIVAGDGFVVLSPAGELVTPTVRASEDEREFILVLDPPLSAGTVGVQWSVRAGDAHPIEGSFSFTTTVIAPAADVVQSPLADVTEAATGPLEASAATGQSIEPPDQDAIPAAEVSLEDFLNDESDKGAVAPIGYLGRLASQAGSLVAIGVVAFALLVSKQRPGETNMFVYLIRQATVLVIAGAFLRAIALVAEIGSVSQALISSTGLAVALRAGGAAALLVSTMKQGGAHQSPVGAERQLALSAVGGGSFSGAIAAAADRPPISPKQGRSSDPMPRVEPTAYLPAAILALSFAFDGHTITKGNHLVTGLVAAVHVAGAGIWLGGLICLVLVSRRRDSESPGSEFVTMVVRFSVLAAAALAAVGAAGLVLTVIILDSVSELWATAWGQILMAKVLIVAVAALAGAFNHFVLVPEIQTMRGPGTARQYFVRVMAVELVALGAAVALTASLVAAAS